MNTNTNTATDDAAAAAAAEKKSATTAARAIKETLKMIAEDERAMTLVADYFRGVTAAMTAIDTAMAELTAANEAKAAARAAKMKDGLDIPNPLADGKIKVHYNLQFAADLYTLDAAAEWADKPSEKAPASACLAWLQYTGDKKMPWKVASVDDMVEAMTAKGVDEDAARKHAATVRNGIAARIKKLMATRERTATANRDAKTVLIGARVSAKGGAEFARFTSYGRVSK